MKVQTENNLVYDSNHPKCQIHFARTHGRGFAFIQCLDTGLDGKTERVKRYWGFYADSLNDKENEADVYRIMNSGSPWPDLPE
ncbi:hypothetical protein BCT01_24050 [Vibrio tasmaniensis]|uniref:Uncharacterized protein n=1 Tax=Vibrio splendidus TaxID=29497 RepID=A0AB35N5Z2_VIBSP|nr:MULTISPECIES: hypothetical protein [Vibrio]CAK2132163.1 transposase [Vibrio crassostreae]MDH5967472.1 hypothetical protein [Vibrio aestuarianus]MDP2504081.1 hypothetical protein [Vibrio splendidus]PMO85042.1 hypothetical protein BCT01_24050 [Vibrio tasmaniensis]CAK2929297.1 transposase [Vibrio crassostreae]